MLDTFRNMRPSATQMGADIAPKYSSSHTRPAIPSIRPDLPLRKPALSLKVRNPLIPR
jgi:hypothetical protein